MEKVIETIVYFFFKLWEGLALLLLDGLCTFSFIFIYRGDVKKYKAYLNRWYKAAIAYAIKLGVEKSYVDELFNLFAK